MFKKYVTLVVFLTLFANVNQVVAQCNLPCPPGTRPNGNCTRCVPVPPGLPIDGGVAWLLVIGAAYGIKKLRENK